MTQFIFRRLLILPITLLGLSILIFGMLQLLDPEQRATMYESSPPKTTRALTDLMHKYGLDQPIYVQYGAWLGQTLQGNLGFSRTAQEPVLDAFGTYFPATLELTIWSFVPIVLVGIWAGVRAAANYGRFWDNLARVLSVVAYSFPTFVFALGLVLIFYAGLRWLPPGRLSSWASDVVYSPDFHRFTQMNTVDGVLNGRFDIALDALRHLALPAITIAYGNCAVLMRVMRASMLEALGQEYTTVARAKGLSDKQVMLRHARRNALIPVTTIGGLLAAGLLNGAGISEVVFDYHGIGWWGVTAAVTFDVPAVIALALFSGLLLVLANLAVDVLYVVLDPRIRMR